MGMQGAERQVEQPVFRTASRHETEIGGDVARRADLAGVDDEIAKLGRQRPLGQEALPFATKQPVVALGALRVENSGALADGIALFLKALRSVSAP